MKHLFVPYELAVKLKEKRFNEHCIACYDKLNMLATYTTLFEPKNYNNDAYCISAPLYQQVADWFRIEHGLHIYPIRDGGWWLFRGADISDEENNSPEYNPNVLSSGGAELSDYYNQYQKAIEEALKLI